MFSTHLLSYLSLHFHPVNALLANNFQDCKAVNNLIVRVNHQQWFQPHGRQPNSDIDNLERDQDEKHDQGKGFRWHLTGYSSPRSE